MRIKTLRCERDIRNCLIPSSLRAPDRGDSSPSLLVTPPLQPPPSPSLLNINLSVPPPAIPITMTTTSSLRRGQASLKRPTSGSSSGNNGSVETCYSSGTAGLSCVRIDPCVNLVLSRFLRSLRSSEAQVAANQAELQRSKFTEDSQNGKRMMSRLRVLEKENAELARQKESGRPAKIANLIGLRRRFIERVRMESAHTEKLIDEAESEVEVFTSTLLMLQRQLSIAHATIEVLAVALATAPASSSASTPAKRCIALLRAAQWPLPSVLESEEVANTEPIELASTAPPPLPYSDPPFLVNTTPIDMPSVTKELT
ncbi:Pre mRNA splicing regulator female lethal2D [Echinococcus multilocularis]|uniref:Pre mRNA splicing regulator female lethal2D n=1 Tax=Echinococcus multilocularis TaxID=6211 RepID=A0A068YF51_ECHMU|nr:Pre mRNA splicing regulator female lethal2D [Echinococcus multilocularis]